MRASVQPSLPDSHPVSGSASQASREPVSPCAPSLPSAQHLLAQQLASAVAGVAPCLNQPVLLPFNMAGQLSGQQGLVLTMPSASLANIQGLVAAAAAAGGIMTLPLQNLQGKALSVLTGSAEWSTIN
ncbi:hypothetical protein SKAU_G00380930 [Synaphobranchus kaupii]|uniref:Uncharacterized protein n=1 Tax=Synaphobranchus kaupii TaxID=118154 RepID=A0A9Q1EDQ6_SYNKA|nr:hypothetical protein SKAU_G00380930 [Synaphobranchus kaupii]